MSTSIQWTDVTDNIIRAKGGGWWCRKISPGCANCYAAKLNQSDYFGGNKLPYTGKPPELELQRDIIKDWEHQRKPKKHFVASMTDVFGDWVPLAWALEFLRGMWRAKNQTFQVLTKRPDIAHEYITRWLAFEGLTSVPPHIWIGASVEDQPRADERIPKLLRIPARIRFLSVEPMLEKIDLTMGLPWKPEHAAKSVSNPILKSQLLRRTAIPGVHWVIFGGESGVKARPCNIEWIRDGVKQCRAAGVACFVKQLGAQAWAYQEEDDPAKSRGMEFTPLDLKDRKGGDISEWPEDLRIREFPTQEAA